MVRRLPSGWTDDLPGPGGLGLVREAEINGPGILPHLTPKYKVDLVELDGQHLYTVDNNPTYLPGVTGILNCIAKEALLPWCARETALYMRKIFEKVKHRGYDLNERFLDKLVKRAKKQPKFIKETAARVGSHAHKVFDSIIRLEKEPGWTPYLDSFMYYLATEKPEFISGDLKVASLEYGYGGSLDALVNEKGRLVICDWKTGKSIWPGMAAQVSAYSFAMKETYGLDYYPEARIYRFEKNKNKYETCKVRDIKDSFSVFECASRLCSQAKLVAFENKRIIGGKSRNALPVAVQ